MDDVYGQTSVVSEGLTRTTIIERREKRHG